MENSSQPLAAVHDDAVLWTRRFIVAVTVAAVVLVVIDANGPVRAVPTVLALLVAPGLALSLVIGPLSAEARALVTVTGSAVLLTVIAMSMALIGSWSPTTGLVITALVTLALVLIPFSKRGGDCPDLMDLSDNEYDSTAEVAVPSRQAGQGGSNHVR